MPAILFLFSAVEGKNRSWVHSYCPYQLRFPSQLVAWSKKVRLRSCVWLKPCVCWGAKAKVKIFCDQWPPNFREKECFCVSGWSLNYLRWVLGHVPGVFVLVVFWSLSSGDMYFGSKSFWSVVRWRSICCVGRRSGSVIWGVLWRRRLCSGRCRCRSSSNFIGNRRRGRGRRSRWGRVLVGRRGICYRFLDPCK